MSTQYPHRNLLSDDLPGGWTTGERLSDPSSDSDLFRQGRRSLRSDVVDLGVRLSATVPGGLAYRCRLTDTGFEAMDVVLDLAYRKRLAELRIVHERIRENVSAVWLQAAAGGEIFVPGGRNLPAFLDDLEQRNLGALESFERHPVALAFDGSFAGRMSIPLESRLSRCCEVVDGPSDVRTILVDPLFPERIVQALEVHQCHFLVPRLERGRIEVDVRRESLVFAFVLDGVLDREGSDLLPASALEWLAAHREGLPLVIEENLIGCGRAGELYAFERTPLRESRPDFIVLNKLFAGWGAKIGAALVRDDLGDPGLDDSCASGFGEDEFSLEVALAVFDALDSIDRTEFERRGGSSV